MTKELKGNTLYIGKVVEQFPDEDTVNVVFIRGAHTAVKARVIHDKANALYGTSGNLPDVGETGIIAALYDYGQEFFWIGSYHDSCDNPCTSDITEIGRSLSHHESDVYRQILPDGTVEFSHPSGTFFKLGSSGVLKIRNRFIRLSGTYNQRIIESYANRQDLPVILTLNHRWVNGSCTAKTYDLDARKKVYTGDFRNTTITMDTAGSVVIDHQTTSGEHMKLSIAASGNTTLESDIITLKGINGRNTAVTIQGTLHTTDWILSNTDITGNMVYDANGAKSMLGMRNSYNPHQHGTSPAPTPAM